MGLNSQVFKVRAISAIFFTIIMLAGLLLNQWSFLLLFVIVHFGCWKEYLNLIEKIYNIKFNFFIKAGLIISGFAIMFSFCGPMYNVNHYTIRENLFLPLLAAGWAILMIGIFQKGIFNLKSLIIGMLGWLYISLSWGMMLSLRQISVNALFGDLGWVIPLVIVISIWMNDTMAYIVGSVIGKTPLSKISPKKTWEGTIGGILLCITIVPLVGAAFNLSIIPLIILSSITAIVGTFGDLLESKIKRMANVKDSGTMMPGHGGFLDRFDSMLLAVPFIWLYIHLYHFIM